MKKRRIVYLLICLGSAIGGYAQLGDVDSLWLQNMIEGKDSIRLNPETMRAIEEGTFLNRENPFAQPLEAPSLLPITRDFREIDPGDATEERIDTTLSPAAALLKDWKMRDSLRVHAAFRLKMKIHEKEEFRIGGTPFAVSAGAQSLLDENVKDGQRRGSVGGSVKTYFSLDNILTYIFRPGERRKRRNRKKAEELLQRDAPEGLNN